LRQKLINNYIDEVRSRGIDILAEIISRPELRFWEINDAKERLEFDLDVYDEKAELSELTRIFK
jgi:hypothetical protein